MSLTPTAALLVSALVLAAPAQAAQDGADVFSGFARVGDAPVAIEADSLQVDRPAGQAVFAGNVQITQGALRLEAARATVFYAAAPPPDISAADSAPRGKITRLRAARNVRITGENNQRAQGDWAEYDVARRQITMGGSIILRQGRHVLTGERLVIDLVSGQSRLSAPAPAPASGSDRPPPRVRGLFGSGSGPPEPPPERPPEQ